MPRERSKVDALVDLGEKVTGKTITVQEKDLMMYGEDITEVLDEITKNYTGGGGSSVTIVTELDNTSTDEEVPSAKCVYDLIGNVETLLQDINTGEGVNE